MAEALLDAQGLSVSLAGRGVLEAVDMRVHSGELLAVLGPNGAGKTTLLRALTGLVPYRGQVLCQGRPLAQLSARERARHIAFVPQHSALRSALSVRDVLLQGRYPHLGALGRAGRTDDEAIERALEQCELSAFAQRPFTELSFGEQRRVLIARALSTSASVLCLDEPTAALDLQHVLRVHALLRTLAAAGLAVVMVLHSIDDALRHADRALLLHRGRAIGAGPVADVLCASAIKDIYGVEMRAEEAPSFHLPERS